jgi:hypothetical protein
MAATAVPGPVDAALTGSSFQWKPTPVTFTTPTTAGVTTQRDLECLCLRLMQGSKVLGAPCLEAFGASELLDLCTRFGLDVVVNVVHGVFFGEDPARPTASPHTPQVSLPTSFGLLSQLVQHFQDPGPARARQFQCPPKQDDNGASVFYEGMAVLDVLTKTHLERSMSLLDASATPLELLTGFWRVWEAHCMVTDWLARLLIFCDGAVPRSKHAMEKLGIREDAMTWLTLSTTSRAHQVFADMVFLPHAAALVQAVHTRLAEDRTGNVRHRGVVRSVVACFQLLGNAIPKDLRGRSDVRSRLMGDANYKPTEQFLEMLQGPVVAAVRQYFTRVAAAQAATGCVASYVRVAQQMLTEEDARCRECFPECTRLAVLLEVRDVLLRGQVDMLLRGAGNGCEQLLAVVFGEGFGHRTAGASPTGVLPHDAAVDAALQQLAAMWSLFCGMPGVGPVAEGLSGMVALFQTAMQSAGCAALKKHQAAKVVVKSVPAGAGAGAGAGAVAPPPPPARSSTAPCNDPEHVKLVLAVYRAGDAVVQAALGCDVAAGKALAKAMECILEVDQDHPELLASYMDQLLRGRVGKLDEDAAEDGLQTCVAVLRHLAAKDLFREFFKLAMCKRVLAKKTVSDHLERAVIELFKTRMGHQFALAMEGMWQDHGVAEDGAQKYDASLKVAATRLPAEVFRPLVLRSGAWPPMVRMDTVVMPPPMAACLTHFHQYFQARNPTRVLTWAFSQGSTELSVRFSPKVVLSVGASVLQAVVLLVFARTRTMALGDLCAATGIPMDSMKNILGSMLFSKGFALLAKTPEGKVLADTDVLRLNPLYTNASKVNAGRVCHEVGIAVYLPSLWLCACATAPQPAPPLASALCCRHRCCPRTRRRCRTP